MGASPVRQTRSLQPVAIGAVVEATKPSEPSRKRVVPDGSASPQAVTRVNVEQASKGMTWEPTRLLIGEGRRRWGTEAHASRSDPNQRSHRGNDDGMRTHGEPRQPREALAVRDVTLNRTPARDRPGRVGWRTGS